MNMRILIVSKSIILLSGGLDSLVTLGYNKVDYNIDLALTFDYGQKSLDSEIDSSKKICEYYGIQHKIIKLDWLKEITKTAIVSEEELPCEGFGSAESASRVWVPNRNSLFLNIAACFCESYNYDYILYGANKDEAENFPDNTEEFRGKISEVFQTSTLQKPIVVAPLINYSKGDIVRIAVENAIPLEFVRSCYNSGNKHCGNCESCYHLKRALIENNCNKYLSLLFNDN